MNLESMPPREFVVFDRHGNEVDSVDPYQSHEAQADPGYYVVKGAFGYEYSVYVPDGGSYEIREMEDR